MMKERKADIITPPKKQVILHNYKIHVHSQFMGNVT